MNAQLTEAINGLSTRLENAKNPGDIQKAIVEIHRQALKASFDAGQTGDAANYTSREYSVGEANTRGLSWKLNLLRRVAEANLTKMVRTGVHGGGTRILGTSDNIDATIAIYEALAAHFTAASPKAFEDYSAENKAEDGTTVHRAGWMNKWLVDNPDEIFTAVQAQRERDAGSNKQLQNSILEANSALNVYQSSLSPAKAPKAEKAPKAKRAPKSNGTEAATTEDVEEIGTVSENVDSEATAVEA